MLLSRDIPVCWLLSLETQHGTKVCSHHESTNLVCECVKGLEGWRGGGGGGLHCCTHYNMLTAQRFSTWTQPTEEQHTHDTTGAVFQEFERQHRLTKEKAGSVTEKKKKTLAQHMSCFDYFAPVRWQNSQRHSAFVTRASSNKESGVSDDYSSYVACDPWA